MNISLAERLPPQNRCSKARPTIVVEIGRYSRNCEVHLACPRDRTDHDLAPVCEGVFEDLIKPQTPLLTAEESAEQTSPEVRLHRRRPAHHIESVGHEQCFG
jgi:hypothetical protein